MQGKSILINRVTNNPIFNIYIEPDKLSIFIQLPLKALAAILI